MARLEIRTPEGVVLSTELAGAGARFAAALIDGCLFAAAYIALALAVTAVVMLGLGDLAELAQGVLIAGLVPGYVVVSVLAHGLGRGQSAGKRVLGLRVATTEGYPPGWLALILRGVLLPIDVLLPLPVPGVFGLATVALTERRQRLGDFVAGTVVVSEAGVTGSSDPFPGETWSALPEKALALSPGLAARLEAQEILLLRDLLARQPLELEYKRELFVRTAKHFAARLELGEFADARAFLKELYLYLREQRGGA